MNGLPNQSSRWPSSSIAMSDPNPTAIQIIPNQSQYVDGYEHLLRGFCRQFGGFEPEIGAMADSPESVISMIAAGRGVFLGLEIGLRGRTAPIDFHLLAELAGQMEIVARWKKQSQAVPTILKFVDVLQQEV